jgi:hypothetical protein
LRRTASIFSMLRNEAAPVVRVILDWAAELKLAPAKH